MINLVCGGTTEDLDISRWNVRRKLIFNGAASNRRTEDINGVRQAN